MWKILGGVVLGVFVGAVALEILYRTKPHLIRDIENKAERAVDAFRSAFREGYSSERIESQ